MDKETYKITLSHIGKDSQRADEKLHEFWELSKVQKLCKLNLWKLSNQKLTTLLNWVKKITTKMMKVFGRIESIGGIFANLEGMSFFHGQACSLRNPGGSTSPKRD